MKALTLTYDKNRMITNFMVYKYNKLWPDHPFNFIIPYQELKNPVYPNMTMVPSDPSIKATMLTIIDQAEPEEWVYWCIDDKIALDLDIAGIKRCIELIHSEQFKDESGLLFCHKNGTLFSSSRNHDSPVTMGCLKLQQRKYIKPFWIHQFIKAKVLREIINQFPDQIPYAKKMDEYLLSIKLPEPSRLWVTLDNYAVFGESSIGGKLTSNFIKAIKKEGNSLPNLPHSNIRWNIFGEKPSIFQKIMNRMTKK
jgi:hypothetical protein